MGRHVLCEKLPLLVMLRILPILQSRAGMVGKNVTVLPPIRMMNDDTDIVGDGSSEVGEFATAFS